eukprot:COSAG06_NODE_71651_length_181_cov_25.804878_1_plen_33_part_10
MGGGEGGAEPLTYLTYIMYGCLVVLSTWLAGWG